VAATKHQSTKHLKKPDKQTVLQYQEPAMPNNSGTEQLAQYEMKLEPIVDKKTYDSFLKAIAMRVYTEFDKSLKGEGIARPELSLVGFDFRKTDSPAEIRMSDYVALNARLIVERAFVDIHSYAHNFMPKVFRDMDADKSNVDKLHAYIESKVQRDLMMEIRTIAMIHIPEKDRYSYVSKLKEL
jgi:hypothetical protein